MFKKIVWFVVLMIALSVPCYSAEWSHGSGNKTADALIFAEEGSFHGIALVADGTNAITVSIYDNTTNSGKLLVPTFIVPGTATAGYSLSISPPVRFNNGVYVDITCSGDTNYVVYYGR